MDQEDEKRAKKLVQVGGVNLFCVVSGNLQTLRADVVFVSSIYLTAIRRTANLLSNRIIIFFKGKDGAPRRRK